MFSVEISSFYKKAAISFIVLTVLLAGFIAYFSLAKAEIEIIPKLETVSVDFRANVGGSDGIEIGDVIEKEVTGEKEFEASDTKIISKNITGKVRIINEYSADQPLVRTTRLLTPEEKLFRIDETILVPAGGEVEVGVYADDPSEITEDVGPTKFTIPGLFEAKQAYIYAVSDEPMTLEGEVEHYVSEDDINIAQRVLSDSLFEQALAEMKDDLRGNGKYSDNLLENLQKTTAREIVEVKSSVEPGEKAENFKMTMTLKVVALAFDEEKILEMAKEKIAAKIPDDKELVAYNMDKFDYLVEDFDMEKKQATVRVYLEASMALKDDAPFLDKGKLIGLTADEVSYYILANKAVQDVNVRFFPFWVKQVPKFKNSIHITIKK